MNNIVEGIISISNDDYFTLEQHYSPKKLNLSDVNDLTFPLIKKPKDKNEFQLIVSTSFKEKLLSLKVICPSKLNSFLL